MRMTHIKIDETWSFADKKRADTGYLTHDFHRYPAKFIPQIAGRLIETYSNQGDIVMDPFAGCGTTLVESKLNGRISSGIDINPVATMITKAKTTPIHPDKLAKAFARLTKHIENYPRNYKTEIQHARIDFWFDKQTQNKLGHLLKAISRIRDAHVRTFFYCAFSNILKNCSIWMQKSNKPTRDFNKIPADPHAAFRRQANIMMKKAKEFYWEAARRDILDIESVIHCADAKNCHMIGDESVDLIVTSPPYVTSYEYADLHQLTALWLGYTDDLKDFRKHFVGTASSQAVLDAGDPAAKIVSKLMRKHKKTAQNVAAYFADMQAIINEMCRVIRKGGKICIVIGDTKIKDVRICNSEILLAYLHANNMRDVEIIKRRVLSKNIPSVRDKKTGRFTKITSQNKTRSYASEYILIVEKPDAIALAA